MPTPPPHQASVSRTGDATDGREAGSGRQAPGVSGLIDDQLTTPSSHHGRSAHVISLSRNATSARRRRGERQFATPLVGDHKVKETPVPIPNTEVKLHLPMILLSGKVGYRRHFGPAEATRSGLLYFWRLGIGRVFLRARRGSRRGLIDAAGLSPAWCDCLLRFIGGCNPDFGVVSCPSLAYICRA